MGKAQIFTLDMIVATGIFILVLLSTAALWDYSREKIRAEEMRNDLEIMARSALSALVETEGSPSDWAAQPFTAADIQSLGLADEFLVLNQTKISNLSSANYTIAKTLLGIPGPGYEFRLDIDTWNGTAYAANHTIGLVPNTSATEVVNVERFTLLDDKWAIVEIKIWKSCEDITC